MLYNRDVRRAALLYLIFAIVSLLTRAAFLPIEIIDMDEAAHAVGSWTWIEGGSLYRDFINNKPPLLYVYYAFAQILFGKGLFAVHILTAIFVVPLTALAVAAFFDYEKRGFHAGLLYIMLSTCFLAHDMQSTNAEILMVLPGAWAIALVRNSELAGSRKRMFFAGLLFGIGSLFKYQIALGIVAVAIACWRIGRHTWIYQLPGFLIAPVVTLALFQLSGGLQALLYWLFWNNLLYSANPISWNEAIGRFASYLLPFLLLTSPFWWFAFRPRMAERPPYVSTLSIALLIVSIPPVFVGFRFYPHYFIQLYFPLLIAALPAIFQANRFRAIATYVVVLFCLTTVVNGYLYYGGAGNYREQDPVYKKIAERLKQDECYSGGRLFVWGYAPAFYYYAGIPPASRFVVMGQARLTGYVSGNLESLDRAASGGVPLHWDWLFEDFQKNGVTYVLDTAPAAIYRWNHFPLDRFPRLKNFVNAEFDRIDTIEDVAIYRRRQCSSE